MYIAAMRAFYNLGYAFLLFSPELLGTAVACHCQRSNLVTAQGIYPLSSVNHIKELTHSLHFAASLHENLLRIISIKTGISKLAAHSHARSPARRIQINFVGKEQFEKASPDARGILQIEMPPRLTSQTVLGAAPLLKAEITEPQLHGIGRRDRSSTLGAYFSQMDNPLFIYEIHAIPHLCSIRTLACRASMLTP
jgi:hypothetical protein